MIEELPFIEPEDDKGKCSCKKGKLCKFCETREREYYESDE